MRAAGGEIQAGRSGERKAQRYDRSEGNPESPYWPGEAGPRNSWQVISPGNHCGI